jgi:hypothetical protein
LGFGFWDLDYGRLKRTGYNFTVPVQSRTALLSLALLVSVPAAARAVTEPVPPAVMARDADGSVTIRAIRLVEPITVDGRLDDPLYRDTLPIDEFVQQEPREGAPASEKTEVWVAYDDQAIYVGARLWESDPSRRVMSDMRRDASNLYNNDHFAVMIDTFYDRRNGYLFYANAQGGMGDSQVANENANTDWNTIWETKSADFDGGWTIEFRIPFRSIRFQEGARVWGINFRRMVRWKTETAFLAAVPASYGSNGINRASSAATLVGLEAPARIRNIDVKAYGLGSTVTNRASSPPVSNHGDGDFGVDAKWSPTQSYVADVTYNTDFAQVEDDEQQLNLTRFSLQYPEKRDFFMEGEQFFGFGTQSGAPGNNPEIPVIFFSRRIGLENGGIVPILGGGRLLGRSGRNQIGILQMRTGEVPALRAAATDFTAMRVQREILRRSRIGMIATRRAPSAYGSSNYAYGVDAVLQFYQNIQFVHYVAKTETRDRTGNDLSSRNRFVWNADRWGIDTEHMFAGEDFNPEVGFVRRPEGFQHLKMNLRFSPRPRNIPGVRKVYYTTNVQYFTDPTWRKVESRDQQAAFRADFTNGDRTQVEASRSYEAIEDPFTLAKGVRVPAGGYSWQQVQGSFTFGPQRKISGTAVALHGSFYDGTVTEVGWRSRLEFSPQFYAEPTITINHVDVPWGRGFSNLVSSRLTYTLTPRMFVSGLVQYQSRNDAVSTNARFRWEYSPGSELFVVYSDGRTTLSRGIPDLQNRSFVVKVTRLFQF